MTNASASSTTLIESRRTGTSTVESGAVGGSRNGKVPIVMRGDGRYVCTGDGCTRTYTDPRHLRLHYKGKHLNIKYSCPYEGCGSIYTLQTSLRSHVKQKHESGSRAKLGGKSATAKARASSASRRSAKDLSSDDDDDDAVADDDNGNSAAAADNDDDDDADDDDGDHHRPAPRTKAPSRRSVAADDADNVPLSSAVASTAIKEELGVDIDEDGQIIANSNVQMSCPVAGCSRTYTVAAHFKRHLRLDHMLPVRVCYEPRCTHFVTSDSELRRHIRSEHQASIYECPVPGCSKQYPWATSTQLHVSSKHAGARFPCGLCPSSYERYCAFLAHRVTKHNCYLTTVDAPTFSALPPLAMQLPELPELSASISGRTRLASDRFHTDGQSDSEDERPRFSEPKRARIASTLNKLH